MITAGLLLIDSALIVLGAIGIFTLIFAWMIGVRNLARLEVTLQAPAQVFADTVFHLHVILQNGRKLMDTFYIHTVIHLSKIARIHSQTLWTAAGSSATVKLSGSIPSRGDHQEHPCILTSKFPLGLFSHERRLTAIREILVYPKAITPREFFATGEFDDAWLGGGLQQGDAPGEPRGIRPFRPGDPAKRIHWPSTIRSIARGRSPRIRESDPPGLRPRKATVIFHSFGTDGSLIRTDHFERGLSLLCGALRHLRSIGVTAHLKADFLAWKDFPTFHSQAWSNTLTHLARAQRAHETEAHDLETAILQTPSQNALIIVSDMPPESWQHTLPQRPALIIDINQHQYSKREMIVKSKSHKIASIPSTSPKPTAQSIISTSTR